MATVVTFKPLSRGRYRVIVDGILGKIVKNPKKARYSIMRANNPRTEKIKATKKVKKAEEFNFHYRLTPTIPSYRPSFGWSW